MFDIEVEKLEEWLAEANKRLHEVASADQNLKKAYEVLVEIKKYQDNKILSGIAEVKRELSLINERLNKLGVSSANEYDRDFNILRRKLDSTEWPAAIDQNLICHSEDQLKKRADNIIKLHVHEFLEDQKFLDFGCGDGYVTVAAANAGATLSVGYDISKKWKFANNEGSYFFTADPKEVRQKGPYDVVLIFDVMDHLTEDPVRVLKEIRQLLSANGKIYMRNHPWCSRHGSHLHEKLNKAFAHLIFDDMELTRIGGYTQENVLKLTDPIGTYRSWFEEADLMVQNETIITKEAEEFFFLPENIEIRDKLENCWEGKDLRKLLSIEYVFYVLSLKTSSSHIF